MIKKEKYFTAIETIKKKVRAFPNHLIPQTIVWSGNINSPGVSDIDLLIAFEDSFIFGNEFLDRFNDIIKEIEHRDIFFLHMPNIYPISCFKHLPKFTFNNTKNMKVIHGSDCFNKNIFIPKEQIIIRSLEFIHARIIDFIITIFRKNFNFKKLLVEGHSFIHSFNSLKNLGVSIDINKFNNFIAIENYRKRIVAGENIDLEKEICKDLYEGICGEFYFLLQNFYLEFQKNVAAHWQKNLNFHEYDETITLDNLTKGKRSSLSVEYKNNLFVINGFSWELKCLFDNYFLDDKNFKTTFTNLVFKTAILEKKVFLSKIFRFNFLNYGNAFGRAGFRPLITGKNLERYAKKII